MQVLKFDSTKINISPLKERWYELSDDVRVVIYTDTGVIVVNIFAGFKFDGRSGGWFADFVAPNLGNQKDIACWLVHDAFGHDIGMSFDMTNELLYGMLRCSDYSWIHAKTIWATVSFSDDWFGQDIPTEQELKNISLVRWAWHHKYR